MSRDRKQLGPALALVVALVSGATAASALPVQWAFTGTVTLVDGGTDELAALAGLGVGVGITVSGSVVFESTAPDFEPSPTHGLYGNLIFSYDIHVGAYDLALAEGGQESISVQAPGLDPDDVTELIELFGGGNDTPDVNAPPPGSDPSLLGMGLLFLGPEGTPALSSDALPLLPPDLSVFTGTGYVNEPQGRVTIEFSIDSIVLVPEPGAGVLLAMVVLGIGPRLRRSH